MTSIYERAMGPDFLKLHPRLQERYRFSTGHPFKGEGVMDEISGGNRFLKPLFFAGSRFNLFFPERGRNVPFTIENQVRIKEGTDIVEWNRSFFIKKKLRKFNAFMFLEDGEVIDYFGEPALLVSSLDFKAAQNGDLLISSKRQWLKAGKFRIPLPRLLYGSAAIRESFDETQLEFQIDVSVVNPLFGQLFYYRGYFKESSDNHG
ncbi:DUF4166 domain-containing protein [Bacillus salacetis]|uniref:DUF4166 domain-containing protein n=1 Tax=Bacillus salacetis TaxID=2315464 RepID=A0A3A1R6F7_9BACI|nr:DUF4166 domain-containing protein [Bacillus salacetis]RIW38418.1 DUF4166 domain-containing protein [Bacillus salacetis]